MMKILEKSNKLLRKLLRILLIALFAFTAYGCPEPEPEDEWADLYGVPGVVQKYIETSTNLGLDEENTQ